MNIYASQPSINVLIYTRLIKATWVWGKEIFENRFHLLLELGKLYHLKIAFKYFKTLFLWFSGFSEASFLQNVSLQSRRSKLNHIDSSIHILIFASEHAFQQIDCSLPPTGWLEFTFNELIAIYFCFSTRCDKHLLEIPRQLP